MPPDRETDASADEVLDVGTRRRLRLGGQWWWLVLVLVVAAPIVVLSLRHSSSHNGAAARTTAPNVRSRAARTGAVEPTTVRPRNACRGIDGCVVRATVPAGIAALARTRLSADVELRVQTFLVIGSGKRSNRMIERDLIAYFHSATVVIRVDHGSAVTSPLTPDPPGTGSLLLHRRNAGFDVRLQYLAPETVPPMLTDLLTMMRDRQLTST